MYVTKDQKGTKEPYRVATCSSTQKNLWWHADREQLCLLRSATCYDQAYACAYLDDAKGHDSHT